MLKVKDLKVKVDPTSHKASLGASKKQILRGLALQVEPGEVVAVMGPNGSGKSTLAYSLMGHPNYTVTGGKVEFLGKNLLDLSIDERVKQGIFLGWQNPVAIKGVSVEQLLRAAKMNCRCEICGMGSKCMTFTGFREYLLGKAKKLKINEKYLKRSVNEGFSGGEKKKLEILQMMVLEPKLAVLDETDSGLDIDALKIVSEGVNLVKKDNPRMGVLLITHYQRILRYIKPDRVVVLKDGKVAVEDGPELVRKLEKEGYEGIK